jgi:hypothetical protein
MLDSAGSPEYVMTWRRKAMQSGAPICRLVARVRRISVSVSSGWPTPSAQEFGHHNLKRLEWRREQSKERHKNGNGFGLTLGQATALWLDGWVSPAAWDYKISSVPGQRHGQLTEQVLGTIASSSPATTGGSGVLSPRFSLWLMGFPEEWACCGERAMQSYRKQRRRLSKRTSKRRKT